MSKLDDYIVEYARAITDNLDYEYVVPRHVWITSKWSKDVGFTPWGKDAESILVNLEVEDPALFKDVARGGQGLPRLLKLIGDAAGRAVGRGVGARGQIAGIGDDQQAPPAAAAVEDRDHDQGKTQKAAGHAVSLAEQVVLHVGQRGERSSVMPHFHFKRLHTAPPVVNQYSASLL